jgi:hypothetical protein
MISQQKTPQMSRRPFVKAVLAGLISFIPAAGALLQAKHAYAYEICSYLLCTYAYWDQCISHVWYRVKLACCKDYRTGEPCGCAYTYYPIACGC